MLAFDAGGQPWPWLSLACAGVSLASWLGANGAMTSELIQPAVLQLQAAIQTLHCQARLLHLDIKPANILWCSELKELKLCDFGMSEPVRASTAQGPKPTVQGPPSNLQKLNASSSSWLMLYRLCQKQRPKLMLKLRHDFANMSQLSIDHQSFGMWVLIRMPWKQL